MKKTLTFALLLLSFFALGAEAEENDNKYYEYRKYTLGNACDEVYDPYEKLNRKIFAFNNTLDHLILRPLAIGYIKVTNNYTKARVGNFLENINSPLTVVNYGLQMNLSSSLKVLWRFIINTTLGVGGLFDVASKVGLKSSIQTFGNTLAHYGVGSGPYLIIPFIGSTTARDMTDIFTNNILNPLNYKINKDLQLSFTSVKLIHDRAAVLKFTDFIAKNSADPYVAIRSSVHQNRESKVRYPKNFQCPISEHEVE